MEVRHLTQEEMQTAQPYIKAFMGHESGLEVAKTICETLANLDAKDGVRTPLNIYLEENGSRFIIEVLAALRPEPSSR